MTTSVYPDVLYNIVVQITEAPEFNPKRPLSSAAEVVKAVLLRPKEFFKSLSVEGPVKEPAIFTLLIGAFTGVLSAIVTLVSGLFFGDVTSSVLGATLLQALALAVLSPVLVGIIAAVYLLSIRTFVGKVGDIWEVYRIVAYAYSVMALAWIPLVYAFVATYALMVLMGFGVSSAYKTPFLTTVVIVLVGFVPCAMGLILLQLATALPFK